MSTDVQNTSKQSDIKVGECVIPKLVVDLLMREYFVDRTTIVKALERGALTNVTGENSLIMRRVELRGQTFDAQFKLLAMGDKQLFGRRVVGPAYIFDTIGKLSK